MEIATRRRLLLILTSLFLVQTWMVYSDPSGRAAGPLSTEAAHGRDLWHRHNCQSCHQLYGFGGFLGPDLTNYAGRVGAGLDEPDVPDALDAREHVLKGGESPEAAVERGITASAPLAQRLAGAERVSAVRGVGGDLAYANRRTCGHGWVMVGDARAFLDPIYSSGVFLALALASAELAAHCIHEALEANDVSAERLGTFEPELGAGVGVISSLIHAFYDPSFSCGEFLRRFPGQRKALIDGLVGDVFKDMGEFTSALEEMTA